ncbi:MAG: hypothetical protein ACRCZI_13155 [Cetobacterium sp.]
MFDINSLVIIIIIMMFIFFFIALELQRKKRIGKHKTKGGAVNRLPPREAPVPENTSTVKVSVPVQKTITRPYKTIINGKRTWQLPEKVPLIHTNSFYNRGPALHADQIRTIDIYEQGLRPSENDIEQVTVLHTMLFEPDDIVHYNNDVNTQGILPVITNRDFHDPDNMIFATILEMNFEDENRFQTEFLHEQHRNFIPPQIRHADSQNVHDTDVNKGIRNIMDTVEIKKCDDTDRIIEKVKSYWLKKNPTKRWEDSSVNKVLRKIVERNSEITNVGNYKELEILNAILCEAEKRSGESEEIIKDMLLVQIDDALEKRDYGDHVQCPTGFVNRIITSLVAENPEDHPKTRDIYEEELLNVAAKVRNDLEQSDDYNNLTDNEQLREFKKVYYNKLETDYKGILDKKDIIEYTTWIKDL